MRAARCIAHRGLDGLVVQDIAEPTVGAGQALVDVRAAAVNFPDLLLLRGEYQVRVDPPFTPGSEFAGVVRAVGDGVDLVTPGERVAGATLVGAFAERIVVDAGSLVKVPPTVDLAEAAAFFVTYNTAWQALRSVAEMTAGDWVVVLGAGGGVGTAAVELARRLGGRVIACASSPDKLAVSRERGAEATVDYRTEDLRARIREITGGGADVVLDPVGGAHAEPALRALAYDGRYVVLGFAAGEIPRIPANLVLLKGISVRGFEMAGFMAHHAHEYRRNELELLEAFTSGQLHPHICARFPLDEVTAALRTVAERRSIGKVIVEP
jgi:NADPH:quinone reductase